MTFRLILGVDPGQSGAIAALADGEFAGFIDMPTKERASSGVMIDSEKLGEKIKDMLLRHSGSDRLAVVEQVSAMRKGKDAPEQGVTSAFRFGQADGMARGVIGCLCVPLMEVWPQKWKRHFGLIGVKKDVARTLAIQRFPDAAHELRLKKHGGRGDALLIALYAHETEFDSGRRAA